MKALAFAFVACTAVATTDGEWSQAAPLPERIQEMHSAVLHGRVYIAGGIDSTSSAIPRAYRFDPAANRWERIADLPAPRHHMPLAVVGDTLYAVGGLSETFAGEANLWLYREDLNAWETRAALPVGRGASGVGVVGGSLIVVGGHGHVREHVDSTAIYDPGMPSRRGGLGSAVLHGRIHTFGGETGSSVFDNHEVYDPVANQWTTAPPMPTARHGLAVAAPDAGAFVIRGGPQAGFAQTNVVEVFVP